MGQNVLEQAERGVGLKREPETNVREGKTTPLRKTGRKRREVRLADLALQDKKRGLRADRGGGGEKTVQKNV